ncbi:hypothetical protein GT347_04265 [Xylophilus rhododendri]|uniref:Uncharacterized protein n=1 Tax=Xylophilus rhododendri TaxID=2697032 RepID=A0A857J2G6_9BURK|nr:hypothetical protein [Xylophilus rhododendri]QHI97262.1 hypothetical protein GT347_04265 [Xylophilus rhododendri]
MAAEFNPSSSLQNASANSKISVLTVLTQGLIALKTQQSQNLPGGKSSKSEVIAEQKLPPNEVSEEMRNLLGLKSGFKSHDNIDTSTETFPNDGHDHGRNGRSKRDLRAMQDRYGRYHYVTTLVEVQPGGQFLPWADGFYRYYHKGVLQGQNIYIAGLDGRFYQVFQPNRADMAPGNVYVQGRTGIQATQAPPPASTSRNPSLPYWGPNQSDQPPASTADPRKADYQNFGWFDANPARPDQRLNHAAAHPGFQAAQPVNPGAFGSHDRPNEPTRPPYIPSATGRDPSKAFYGSNQSDKPETGTRNPGQADNNKFHWTAATRSPMVHSPSTSTRRLSTKPPAPLYQSRYDENGQPVDESEDYTAVTDYYGRTIKTHVVGYDMNGKKIYSHVGPRKLIGMLPNKTAVYGDYERVLIGWDENRRPVYLGDNFKQGTIDPQYLGRTASTPSYGKGFEFADTNWWEHNYTTTTRAPRIYISTSRPSNLNIYDKHGHFIGDAETGRARGRPGQHTHDGPGNRLGNNGDIPETTTKDPRAAIYPVALDRSGKPTRINQAWRTPTDRLAPDYGPNNDPAYQQRYSAAGRSSQRYGNSSNRASWQLARPKYPQYFIFEDITYRAMNQALATVRSKRQIGVKLTEPAPPPFKPATVLSTVKTWPSTPHEKISTKCNRTISTPLRGSKSR